MLLAIFSIFCVVLIMSSHRLWSNQEAIEEQVRSLENSLEGRGPVDALLQRIQWDRSDLSTSVDALHGAVVTLGDVGSLLGSKEKNDTPPPPQEKSNPTKKGDDFG